MGRRTRMNWDGQPNVWGALAVVGAAFLVGGIVGCILGGLVGDAAAQELSDYLLNYLTLASGQEISPSFWAVAWEHLRFPLGCFLLGFTALGIVGLPILFAVRGFLLTFSVACFCRLLGYAGMGPAFFLFGLPALIWAPILFLLGTQSFLSSVAFFRRALGESKAPLAFGGGYFLRCGYCGVGIALGIALDCWVVPSLLCAVARMVL